MARVFVAKRTVVMMCIMNIIMCCASPAKRSMKSRRHSVPVRETKKMAGTVRLQCSPLPRRQERHFELGERTLKRHISRAHSTPFTIVASNDGALPSMLTLVMPADYRLFGRGTFRTCKRPVAPTGAGIHPQSLVKALVRARLAFFSFSGLRGVDPLLLALQATVKFSF